MVSALDQPTFVIVKGDRVVGMVTENTAHVMRRGLHWIVLSPEFLVRCYDFGGV